MQLPSDPSAQLESFLRSDPGNDTLRAEVFETALRRGDVDRAERHLRAGLAQGENVWGWRLREAQLLMAQQRWPAARAALDTLRSDPLAPPALVETASIDAAQVALRLGDAASGVDLLRPLLGQSVGKPAAAAQQVLWLRLLHRAGELQEAVEWADSRWRAGQLAPAAAGVASLIALDLGDLVSCRRWADAALQQDGIQMEALVARASVALGEQDTAAAQRWLHLALQHNPSDARARSALAFAELQAGQLVRARQEFEAALSQDSSHIGTWHGLGWACLLLQELPAARAAFETALAMDRNFAESHGGMAVVQAMEHAVEAARGSVERALRLDRNCLSAHYAQSILDGTAHDGERLRRLAQRLLAAKGVGRQG